jgi:ketosteroid isomerase-like protein
MCGLLGFVAGCARSTQLAAPSATTALRAVSEAFNRSANAKNADSLVSYYAPNIVSMSPQGRAPVYGLADNRAAWARLFRGGNPIHTMTTDSVVVSRGNDVGYVTGKWTVGVDTPNGRAEGAGDYLAVWRLIDGQWKIVAVSAYQFR